MTDRTQDADAMSFEDLLASPYLQFDLRSEVLPHLLEFGPSGAAPAPAATFAAAPARRPWLFQPAASTTVACA